MALPGGRSQLTGVATGLYANNLTALGNNEALFTTFTTNQDGSGTAELWVTDGTPGGTSQLNIGGASTGTNADGSFGLNPQGFTAYEGKVLFSGFDSSGNDGLWVTDGTLSERRR